MNRTPLRKTIRLILALTVFFLPGLEGPLGSILVIIAVASALAYEGHGRLFFPRSLSFIVLIELFWAFDLGVISLPYTVAAASMTLTERFISISPLSHQEGWRLIDILRSWIFAVAISWMVILGSSVVESIFYRRGIIFERAAASLSAGYLWIVPLGCVVALVILRRIDVPFRRHITFNS
jgi:hypothetical protein